MTNQPTEDGYPDSPPEDLVPDEPDVSLGDADREQSDEGRADVEERGGIDERGATDDSEDEDRLGDSPDADQLAAAEYSNGGSRSEDQANFDDNSAAWSRDRP